MQRVDHYIHFNINLITVIQFNNHQDYIKNVATIVLDDNESIL